MKGFHAILPHFLAVFRRGTVATFAALVLAAVLPALLAPSAAAAPPAVQPADLRGSALLPAVGMKLPLPQDAQARPLPPVDTKTYVLTRGSESWTEDRHRALDLWYATQHVAEWVLPRRGSRLIVGAVTLAPPMGFADTDVTREQFAEYTNSPQASVEALDERLLRLWMESFTGCSLGEPRSLPPGRTRLSRLMRFPTGRSDIHAWAMHFDRGSGGLAHLPDVWIALVSVLDVAGDGAAEEAFVEKGVLPAITPMGRFEGRESPAARTLREKAQRGVRQHPTRDAAHASVAAHPDWWALDSEDYVLLSNGNTTRRLATDLLEDLQEARAFYQAAFPGFADTSDDVSVVRLFASAEEYDAYVGPDYAWTAGLYDGNRRELVIRPIPSKTRDAAYRRALQTALHEGFHQYIHQATGIAQPSVWFNEGYACLFECLTFRNGKPMIDEDASRFRVLEAFLKAKPPQPVPLRALLGMDYEAFYAGSDGDRSLKYALGWALVYFLERGAPLVRNRPYAGVRERYLAALQETGDGATATALAFQGIDLDALERDFRSFWTSSRDRSLAKRR